MIDRHKPESYYLVDRDNARLLIFPLLANIDSDSRVSVYDHKAGRNSLIKVIPSGERCHIPLRELLPLSDFSIKLQLRQAGVWVDHLPSARMASLGNFSVSRISPGAWGISDDCVVILRNPHTHALVARHFVAAGDEVDCSYETDSGKLLLSFFRSEADGSIGAGLTPPIRLVPTDQLGRPPADIQHVGPELAYTRRQNVTLAPVVSKPGGKGGLATRGYLAARQGTEPIVEAMDFALGRQHYLYQPYRAASKVQSGTAIYLGLPHGSWGHFLTQGLSRVWYALLHPELPVVWDCRRLRPYQQEVLDLIGMKNQQHFITEPVVFENVIFPFPGVCIGDFVLKGFTDSIGRVPAANRVPGKKTFLSRSGLDTASGGLQGRTDAELDRLAERYGFALFHPEQHSIKEQLDEISSSETVLAVEGSALHSVLLLRDPLDTTFWALSRHRGGSGVYAHIKAAKELQYETLNFLRSRLAGHRDEIDIDLDEFETALARTNGLTENLHLLNDRIEHPIDVQTSFQAHMNNTQTEMSHLEGDLTDAFFALRNKDYTTASAVISSYL